MMDLPNAPRTRLFTTWGTVLYVDAASGQLRHGAIEDSPANAVFVAAPTSTPERLQGWIMHDIGLEPIICGVSGSQLSPVSDTTQDWPGPLELVPLERGLIAFRAEGLFLCAQPDGGLTLSNPVCSTWECFLASADWCAAAAGQGQDPVATAANAAIDRKRIAAFIVDPRLRVKANAGSKMTKVLIYGYPYWSHGRVYYDLCKHLHRRGYIVDIINWQINHAGYFSEFVAFYDLFLTALDGARALVDNYAVPYDRIIALSHHEFDMRMLIEQKGMEVFEKFANYGVVGESLYSTSQMIGVPRVPMVASLGTNFSEFYSEIPERLATVGYASSMSVKTYGVEWKRGELAEASAREAGLAFKIAGWTGQQISLQDMPDFYRTVDAVLISSISESGPLPVLEAAAAGRLVIGTPVGHFPLKAYQGGGIIAPIEAAKYKTFTTETLRYYKDNPTAFADKCRGIQEAARQFDWQYMIGEWVELIQCAGA